MGDGINIEFNTESITNLINLVKCRPALYDKTLLGYSDQPLKQKLWFEICEIMTPGWRHRILSEKVLIGTKIQKKWLEIKSAYQKELNLQKVGKLLGKSANKCKKYKYFDKLDFLMPTLDTEFPSSSSVQVRTVKTPVVPAASTTNSHRLTEASGQVHKNKKKPSNKEQYLKIFNVQPNREIDEDKHFLLSIVPSLQRMQPTQKMRVKMMFLQAIHDIEQESQQTNQARQFGAPPNSCTTTSDNLSNPPSLVQSSPTQIQSLSTTQIESPPTLPESQPRLVQSPPQPESTTAQPVNSSSKLIQSPPIPIQSTTSQIQSPPRETQSSPSLAPQKTNETPVSTVRIKDISALFEKPPELAPNCFKCEIVIDD